MRFWEATGEQSPADQWIEHIYSEYPVSPFNPNQHAILSGEGERQTIALFELTPSKSVRGAVELHWIQAYPQRQGVGTAAIRELQAKARAAGIKMSLYPKPNGSVSQASLKRLYKRLGFNPIHKGAATMVWDPAVSEQVASKFSEYEIAIMEGGGDVTSTKQVTVYHGNQGGIHREFITPMWWTESYEDAAYYATLNDMDGYVYKATLSCKTPYVISKQDANAAVQNWRKLAIKGYDCIHDTDTGDWIPFHNKDIHLIGYDSLDPEEVNEGNLQLTEIADKPYAFQYAQHGAMKSVYGFETDAGAEYMIHIHPMASGKGFQNDLLNVSFALLQDGEAIDTQTGGAGRDALRIFGTVVNAVKDSLAARTQAGLDIKYIRFAGSSEEPGRVKLYQRFARNIGRYLPGWEYDTSAANDVDATFIVRRVS